MQAQLCAAAMGSQRMGSGHLLLGLARGGDELTRCIIGDIEVRALEELGAKQITLGPRILRTETAAIAAATMAMLLWGDIG